MENLDLGRLGSSKPYNPHASWLANKYVPEILANIAAKNPATGAMRTGGPFDARLSDAEQRALMTPEQRAVAEACDRMLEAQKLEAMRKAAEAEFPL